MEKYRPPINYTNFVFRFNSPGNYEVIYRSEATGQQSSALITDIDLINATKNSSKPKKADLIRLKKYIKQQNTK